VSDGSGRDGTGDDPDSDVSGPTPRNPEPEEFDPTERYGNPEEDLPNVPEVEVPTVENPADRLPDPSDVDREVRRAFWTAVVWMDVAIAGVTLGPLFVLFGGDPLIGAAAFVVGVLAAFRTYQTYRAFVNRDGADDK
jgi:hypothetical protein